MEYLDVLMPTKEGRFIPQEVIDGLLRQNIPFRLWVSTAISDGDYALARNHIKQYTHSRPYVLMLDNDTVLPPRGLETMIKFLQTHGDFAAIALQKDGYASGELSVPPVAEEPPHVDMSCVLFRTEVLRALTFSYPGGDFQTRQGCECIKACRDIRAGGKRIGFLVGIAARHIYDTEGVRLSKEGAWR